MINANVSVITREAGNPAPKALESLNRSSSTYRTTREIWGMVPVIPAAGFLGAFTVGIVCGNGIPSKKPKESLMQNMPVGRMLVERQGLNLSGQYKTQGQLKDKF